MVGRRQVKELIKEISTSAHLPLDLCLLLVVIRGKESGSSLSLIIVILSPMINICFLLETVL